MVMLDESQEAVSVFVQLSNDGKQLEWRSLALVRNKPKIQGEIPVTALQSVSPLGDSYRVELLWTQSSSFRLSTRERIVALELDTEEEFGRWLQSLSALLHVWKPVLADQQRAASQRHAHHAAREQELQERKRQREEKKRELGLDKIGMSHTAHIMASR